MALRKELRKFNKWLGVWNGSGDLPGSDPGIVRVVVDEGLDGEVIEIVVESVSSTNFNFLSGGIGLLVVRTDGSMRVLGYSTLYGSVVLEEVPDDPGVLAVEGVNDEKSQISVTFVVDKDIMYLTTRLRLHGQDEGMRSVAKLRRQHVWPETEVPKPARKK